MLKSPAGSVVLTVQLCVHLARVYSRCEERGESGAQTCSGKLTHTDRQIQTAEAQGELDGIERSACCRAAACRTQRSPVCRGRLPTTFIHQSISAPNAEPYLSLASIRTEVYLCIYPESIIHLIM
jgi:hypothetical protein